MKNVRMPLAGMPVSHSTRPSPRDVAMTFTRRPALACSSICEVARGLVRRSGDVGDPRRDRAGCCGWPTAMRPGLRRAPPRSGNAPAEPGRLRGRGARRRTGPRVSGASASSSRSHTARSKRSSVPACGSRLSTPSNAGNRAEQRRMGALQVDERQLLDERVAAHQHGGDRVRAAVRRAEHDEARARDAGTCAAHVFRPASLASIVRTTRPPMEWASSRIGWLAVLGERQHLVDRGAAARAAASPSGWRQS